MSTYGDAHAAWYDELYRSLGKDHATEAQSLLDRVTDLLGRDAASWLDVACGTGQHLAVIGDAVDEVVGVDLSEPMLDVARARLGGRVELRVADQRDARPRAHASTSSPRCSARSGTPPTSTSSTRPSPRWRPTSRPAGCWSSSRGSSRTTGRTNAPRSSTSRRHGRRAVRVMTSRREGDVSVLEVAVVSAAAGRLTVEREDHRMLLVPHERLLDAVAAAGSRGHLATTDRPRPPAGEGPPDRGLVVARRPAERRCVSDHVGEDARRSARDDQPGVAADQLQRLWAPWRFGYVAGRRTRSTGCPFCVLPGPRIRRGTPSRSSCTAASTPTSSSTPTRTTPAT